LRAWVTVVGRDGVFRSRRYSLPPIRLDQVIPGAPAGARDVDVTDLAYDNRAVAPGTLFFCVPGFTRDGHEFGRDAIARGVVARSSSVD
jgi:UDP-N-acetylmuramyl tripeptide synthase